MDPALDPPPLSAQPTGPADAPLPPPAAVNPLLAQPVPVNYPNYAEMITTAITALNERDGSSSRAIAKYIETQYPALPANHLVQLADSLKLLKDNGQLVMVKKSYALASRSTAAAVNGDVPADPAASASKRRPGRPPKPKPDAGQAAVPVFAPALNMNVEPAAPPVAHIPVAPVRGRGRPPKRGPGRPVQSSGAGAVGKSRGRPKKNDVVVAPSPAPGRPRGRPPKPVNAVQGAPVVAPVPVGVKRRGRPPKAGAVVAKKPRNMTAVQPRKHRQLSGKPLGRPKKNAAVPLANDTPDAKLLSAYFKLNTVLETLKTKVKDTVIVVRPSLNSDDAITALNELEALADTPVSAPPGAPGPPQQPQPQS